MAGVKVKLWFAMTRHVNDECDDCIHYILFSRIEPIEMQYPPCIGMYIDIDGIEFKITELRYDYEEGCYDAYESVNGVYNEEFESHMTTFREIGWTSDHFGENK